MLTPYTLNAITFQLTAGASLKTKRNQTVTLDASVVKNVATAILSMYNGNGSADVATVPEIVRIQCTSMLASAEHSMTDESPSISLTDALAALRQVRVSTSHESRVPVATMMGATQEAPRGESEHKKRRIEDIKKSTVCFGCGKVGHWFKDRRDCQDTMRIKMQNRPPRNAEGLRGPVFRNGGQ